MKISNFFCPICNERFLVDDIDYNFKGCEDDYLYCEKCNINAFIKIRYGRPVKVEYSKDGEILNGFNK